MQIIDQQTKSCCYPYTLPDSCFKIRITHTYIQVEFYNLDRILETIIFKYRKGTRGYYYKYASYWLSPQELQSYITSKKKVVIQGVTTTVNNL